MHTHAHMHTHAGMMCTHIHRCIHTGTVYIIKQAGHTCASDTGEVRISIHHSKGGSMPHAAAAAATPTRRGLRTEGWGRVAAEPVWLPCWV